MEFMSYRIGFKITKDLGSFFFDWFKAGINVAARIELLAELGAICISVVVYEEIRNKPDITATYLGEKNLKMFCTPYFY